MNFPAGSEIALPPAAIDPPKRPRRRRIWLWLLIVAVAILLVLTLDLTPTLPKPSAPRAEQVEQTRIAAKGLRDALDIGRGDATILVSREQMASATALANWVGSFGRFQAVPEKDALRLQMSRRIFGPVWVNLGAIVPPSKTGMPRVRLTVGRLALGETVSNWAMRGARVLLLWRGVHMPPLDDIVKSVAIDKAMVTARIHLPLDSPLMTDLSGLRVRPVDALLTAQIYCRLLAFDGRWPSTDMAVVVNRAFGPNTTSLDQVEQNRAAFVALAMYTASSDAGRLAGNAEVLIARCAKQGHTAPLLLGRDDLPKHWSLSAALSVALGDDVGKAMGEWKELSDSRPNGSGFSFVDLSADRSGLAAAKAATDPARAARIAAQMRSAKADALLPIRSLAMAEGLSEEKFVSTYDSIDSARFAEAKARIDRVIAQTIGE